LPSIDEHLAVRAVVEDADVAQALVVEEDDLRARLLDHLALGLAHVLEPSRRA
jgi:hypothetical protein